MREDQEQYVDEVEKRLEEEKKLYAERQKNRQAVDSSFIEKCLNTGELGDGILYAELLRDQFVYSAISREWYYWAGHHWELDIQDRALYGTEQVTDRLYLEITDIGNRIEEAMRQGKKDQAGRLAGLRDKIEKKIWNLRKYEERKKMLKSSLSCEKPLSIKGTEFDTDPWLFGCANGVMNLKSHHFRDGRQDDWISKPCPTERTDKGASCEEWIRFLMDIFENKVEIVEFLQRLLGMACIGKPVKHVLIVFTGKGRNGKGTLVETLIHILGPLAGSIQAELLLDQRRSRSSAGPSPDIMSLKGLRFAVAAETEEGQRFAASKVKWLTGGSQLVGRNPNDKYETRFEPTHTLFLETNNEPHVSPDDFAFWERTLLIPFRLSFVDREPVAPDERRAINNLADRLKTEASGILAWLFEGCLKFQQEGLNPPQEILDATAGYRRGEDMLADFLETECDLTSAENKERSKDLYEAFVEWYRENINANEKQTPTPKRFGTLLTRRFEKKKVNGVYWYLGISCLTEMEKKIRGAQRSTEVPESGMIKP